MSVSETQRSEESREEAQLGGPTGGQVVVATSSSRGWWWWWMPWWLKLTGVSAVLVAVARSLFLSNGPGDPTMCKETIEQLKKLINDPNFNKPIFGICLGNQLLGLAAGPSPLSRFPHTHNAAHLLHTIRTALSPPSHPP